MKGPAKIEATSMVRQLTNGQPLLGGMVKEFDLKLTGTGTVTVAIVPPVPCQGGFRGSSFDGVFRPDL